MHHNNHCDKQNGQRGKNNQRPMPPKHHCVISAFIGLVHVLLKPILMQPNWIGVTHDELIHVHAIDSRRASDSFLLSMDENGHELFATFLPRSLLSWCQLSLRLCHIVCLRLN